MKKFFLKSFEILIDPIFFPLHMMLGMIFLFMCIWLINGIHNYFFERDTNCDFKNNYWYEYKEIPPLCRDLWEKTDTRKNYEKVKKEEEELRKECIETDKNMKFSDIPVKCLHFYNK